MRLGDLSAGEAEALMQKLGGAAGLAKLLSGEWVVGEPGAIRGQGMPSHGEIIAGLLQLMGEVTIVLAAERFVVRDKFVIGTAGELPISYIGDDFTDHFLSLVEEGVKGVRLKQYKLLKSSVDAPIFVALGGQNEARVALAHVFEFLKTADRSLWFFFYVADASGTLWAMDTYWRDHGWDLEVYSVTYPRGWRSGGRVVSR